MEHALTCLSFVSAGRAVPALQNAAPAVPAERPQPVASPRPLGMLTNALGRATKGLQQGGQGTDSPINGLLYVSGNITGSRAQPTGEVAVRLYDAAVGECWGVWCWARHRGWVALGQQEGRPGRQQGTSAAGLAAALPCRHSAADTRG